MLETTGQPQYAVSLPRKTSTQGLPTFLCYISDTQEAIQGHETGEALLQALETANVSMHNNIALPWEQWIGAFTFQATSVKALKEMSPKLDPTWMKQRREDLVKQLGSVVKCLEGWEIKEWAIYKRLEGFKQRAQAKTLTFAKRQAEEKVKGLDLRQAKAAVKQLADTKQQAKDTLDLVSR